MTPAARIQAAIEILDAIAAAARDDGGANLVQLAGKVDGLLLWGFAAH